MRRNINGFLMNQNSKVITVPQPNEKLTTFYEGKSFKENGTYYFYYGIRCGKYLYIS